jgi:hypothetical protein
MSIPPTGFFLCSYSIPIVRKEKTPVTAPGGQENAKRQQYQCEQPGVWAKNGNPSKHNGQKAGGAKYESRNFTFRVHMGLRPKAGPRPAKKQ